MKKNPAIKEDNKARQFASVQRVVINNTSSGTSLWVPEETSETDELTVTENGVYCAYDDNVFGYSKIIVNISESLNDRSEKDKAISKITGTNPDTGDTESYGVDENGNLTRDVIPSGLPQAIHLVIEPRKKVYDPGETLDFSGIHVYLLDGEGHQWTSDEYPTGEIPFDELIFPETVANSESASNPTASMEGLDSFPFSYAKPTYTWSDYDDDGGTYEYYGYNEDTGEWIYAFGEVYTAFQAEDNQYASFMVASKSPIQNVESRKQGTKTIDGKTVYYSVFGSLNRYIGISPIVRIQWDAYSSAYAWAMIYGTIIGGGQQEVSVQWVRAEDGRTLEDTYMITINVESQSENESGGSSSGGEHSGGDF